MDSGVKHGICSKCRLPTVVTLPTELRGRTAKAGDDLGGESRRRKSKGTYECCAAYHYEHKWVIHVLN